MDMTGRGWMNRPPTQVGFAVIVAITTALAFVAIAVLDNVIGGG